MTEPAKRGPGRPPRGAAARRKVVTIKLSEPEYAAIASAVASANAAGEATTVSGWIVDHALEPLGLG